MRTGAGMPQQLRTLTDLEVRENYGDPSRLIREDGGIDSAWETLTLGFCYLPAPLPLSWDRSRFVLRVRCHRLIVTRLERVLRAIHQVPEAWASIGDFGGCYAWRPRRGSRRRLSMHCWGIAIDLDVADNADHSVGMVHPFTIEAFNAEGFYWGGRFAGDDRDPMHFEIGVAA